MEGKEPTKLELINKIQLLKQALLFYGNHDNYVKGYVEQDNGHQAKFALDQLKKIDEYNEKIINESNQIMEQLRDENLIDENVKSESLNKLKNIENIVNKYKNNE